MRQARSRTPALPSDERDALVITAMQQIVMAATALGVTVSDLQTMLELGMTPMDVVDYLEAKLNRRFQ